MSSDTTIRVEHVSKCFHIYARPHDRLLQMLSRGRKQYFREFWALKDISFEVARGEAIGIVGRNGSGKSTLLQIICGTLTPTTGTINTEGRIAALLELGSGFNPEFTGRENVYLNASVLGLSTEEVDARFDDIAAFADIGTFLDQPVKTYSSGMAVRLAFAVQAQVDPDILIIDEALAVGDAKFQAKCFTRLRQLKENGTSILLVTHSSEQVVTHCSRAILLDSHQVQIIGEPRTVVNRYLDLLFGRPIATPQENMSKKNTPDMSIQTQKEGTKSSPATLKSEPVVSARLLNAGINTMMLAMDKETYATRPNYNPHEYRWGDRAARLIDFHLFANNVEFPTSLQSGTPITITAAIQFDQTIINPIFGFTLKTKEGVTLYGTNSHLLDNENFATLGQINTVIIIQLRFIALLTGGDYFISLGVASHHGEDIVPHDRRYDSIHISVAPTTTLYGLVDLSLSLDVKPLKNYALS